MKPLLPSPAAHPEIQILRRQFKSAFGGLTMLSAVLNVLLLGGSIFMMLVYDMALPARSVPTLVGLLGLVTVVYLFQGFLEVVRGRLLLSAAGVANVRLSASVHRLIGLLGRTRPLGDSLQPMRDLDAIRRFLSGTGPGALVDLPWMVFFIGVLFLLHPWFGVAVLAGGLILVALTVLTERYGAAPSRRLGELSAARQASAYSTSRHAEVIRALGMEDRLAANWSDLGRRHLVAETGAARVTGALGTTSKTFRMLLQSVVLSIGAVLVMEGKVSGGAIFASSILSSRALAPVELAIANWRGFVGARQSWSRLQALLAAMPSDERAVALPVPSASLAVESLTLTPAGSDLPTVRGVGFSAKAGQAIAVLGPSGCGKSTLIRGLVGALDPTGGTVRIDGATLDQWPRAALGRHIGYLPQNVELLAGTIADNIGRFDPAATSEAVVAAAMSAGVHELILRLPEGYATQVGPDGVMLSAGQRQRVALARALYGDPFLLVLDEPNSNLDIAGEAALAAAIGTACGRGAIVVLVAHRPAILASVDLVLLMQDGRATAFGPKERLVAELLPPAPRPAPPAAMSAIEAA